MSIGRRRALLGAAGLLTIAAPRRLRAQTPRSFRDAAGRAVAVPDAARRVFPAGPGAAVLVAVVAPQALLGWISPPRPDALALLPASLAALPALGRLTGAAPSADGAGVAVSGADLVLDMGTVNPAYAALADRVQAESGIPAVLLDGALARTPALFRETGALLGAVARGEALAMAAERLLELVRSKADPSLRAWLGHAAHAWDYAPAGGLQSGVPTLLGLRLPGISRANNGGWVRGDAALLREFDPDLIILPDARALAAAQQDDAFRATAAARAGRLLVPPRLPFGWVEGPPSVQRLLGLPWLLSSLHPKTLPPEAAASEIAALFALLFGTALDDARLLSLLRAPAGR
jgi:iron complex transport system substrate-binding protein